MMGLLSKLHRKADWQFKKTDLSETTEPLSNPARGWYQIYTFPADAEPDFNELEWCLDRADRLALLLVDIGAFRDRDLDEECLGRIGRILDFFAKEQYDIILRVVYDRVGKGMEREPSFFSQVLSHLGQIGPLLKQYSTAIFIYQGMLVGNWGEMHSSRFLGEEHMRQMADALRFYRGKDTYLAVRRPMYWRRLHTYTDRPAQAPFDGMGLFDDGIFGSESHLGTFGTDSRRVAGWDGPWESGEELAFVEELCKAVPNGGEAVYGAGFTEGLHREKVVDTLRRMHVTYLNKVHDAKILEIWKNWSCAGAGAWSGRSVYDYIGAHLGYRFWIRKVAVTPLRAPEGACRVEIEIENVGFANCYQEGEVWLERMDSRGESASQLISCDIREWNAGETRTVACVMEAVECRLFLSARRRQDGARIRFANRSDKDGRAALGSLEV